MRSCWRAFLVLSLTLFAGGLAALLAQQATKPLTDQELIYLLEKKVSSSALADMVQSYGVAFQADEGVLDRLKKAGASEALLEAIRRQAKRLDLQIQGTTPKPAAPEPEAVPPPAREHLQLGQQKLKNYDYQGALGEFAEAERIRPQWEEVFNQRGLAFAAMARYSEAAAEWKKYLALAPAGVDKTAIQQRIAQWETRAANIEQSHALLVQGDQQLQRGDAKSAAQSFGEAVTLNRSVGSLLAFARAQLQQADYGGLADTARQAGTLDPQSALASLYLADAELRRGKSEVSSLEKGLKLNPNLAYGLALVARKLQQRASQAGGPAKPAAGAAEASSAEEQNRRGWVLWNGGSFQPALEALRKATGLDPAEDGWQCDLAYARLAQRDLAGAQATARQAVAVNPKSVCGHYALALALERSGEHNQATMEYQQAEKLGSALGVASLLRLGAPAGDSTATKP